MKLPIPEQEIRELARQARHCNVFPMFLPNEYWRDSETSPVARLLHKVVPDAAELVQALTDTEFAGLIGAMPPGVSFMLGAEVARATQEQRERVVLYYLVAEVYRVYLSFGDVVSSGLKDSDVFAVYPELTPLFDKDGLLRIDDRFTLHDGGIQYKDHILHYHQFLRRGYTSNPNFDFLGSLWRFYYETAGTNSFRVAIDHRRIMPLDAYKRLVECDTWFGPGFDRDRLDDPNAVGLTIVKRNPNSLFRLSNDLERTEFYWSFRDQIKTLEVEEVSNVGYSFDQFYLNRYLHAERDVSRKMLRHTDGAVKVYLRDAYAQRLGSQMPQELKSYRKIKLWRIDGDVDVDRWLELTALFFKGNEMILEYFDPAKFEAAFEERIRDFEKWKANQGALHQ